MRRMLAATLIISSMVLAALACGDEQKAPDQKPEENRSQSEQDVSDEPRRDRLMGIDVNEGDSGDFEAAFSLAADVGLDFVSLTIYWDEFETAPETYEPEINWLEIADSYYSAAGMDVALVIAPIDTNVLHVPQDLQDLPFDHPEVIARFKSFLDYALPQLESVKLVSVSIGNEVDAYLGTDQSAWTAYTSFFAESVDYIHELDPSIDVGVKGMFDGLTQNQRTEFESMNRHSDVILVTYYPLKSDFSVRPPETVYTDFETLVEQYNEKPIYLLELGYPSGTILGSSENDQAVFIENVFEAWDQHADSIKAINFTWLHDISPADVDYLGDYYGIHNQNFLTYLSTLGLVHSDGTDKDAFVELQKQASARGW